MPSGSFLPVFFLFLIHIPAQNHTEGRNICFVLPKTAEENPLIPPFSAYMRGFLFLRLSQYVVGNSSVDGDQVEAADADKNPIKPQLTAPMIATVSAV